MRQCAPGGPCDRPLRDDDAIDLVSGRHETIQRFVTPEPYSERPDKTSYQLSPSPQLAIGVLLDLRRGQLETSPRCCWLLRVL